MEQGVIIILGLMLYYIYKIYLLLNRYINEEEVCREIKEKNKDVEEYNRYVADDTTTRYDSDWDIITRGEIIDIDKANKALQD